MIDHSPQDDEPTFEQAISDPTGTPKYDVDGSLTGCAVCGNRFGRFDSRVAYVQAGTMLFRHTTHAQAREDQP